MAEDIFGQMAANVPAAIDNNAAIQSGKAMRQARSAALQGAVGGQITPNSANLGSIAAGAVDSQSSIANKAEGAKSQAATEIGTMALQNDATGRKAAFQQRKIQIGEQTRTAVEQLRVLDNGLAKKLFDDQMDFAKDEIGRTVFTEHQLMDYATLKFKRDEDFQDYRQSVSQMSERRTYLLKAASKRIEQTLLQTYEVDQQEANQELQARLIKAKADIQQKIAEQAAANEERGAMWGTIGTVGGVVVGVVAAVAVTVSTAGTGAVAAASLIAAGASAGGGLGKAGGSAYAAATMDKSTVSPSASIKATTTRPIRRY